MTIKVRAVALSDNNIGKKRYELYKNVIERINKSCEDGYHLEAIALIESLLSDRLESYLTFIKGEDFSFKTLERIIKNFKQHQAEINDEELSGFVLDELEKWKEKRNIALHEMAKIDLNNPETWEQKSKGLADIAKNGLILFRKIDQQISKLRKKAQS